MLKIKTSYGHAIALWKKRCGIDQKRLIIQHIHVYKYWCLLQGSGYHPNDKKFGPVFVKLQALYRERCIWDSTHTCATHAFISHRPCRSTNLLNISISRRFPGKCCYHHVLVKTYSFTWLVIRASISFFEIGAFPKLIFTFKLRYSKYANCLFLHFSNQDLKYISGVRHRCQAVHRV